jgi:folate-binding protein YgfZ
MSGAEAYERFKQAGGVADLSARARFRLTGADRVRYLNGQVSNDARKASSEKAIHACLMTAKGKMCADVFISAAPDFLSVDADAPLRESLAARLERYIISDDVTLRDVTDETCLLHVFGAVAEPQLRGLQILRAERFGRPGFDLVGPRDLRDSALAQLSGTCALLEEETLEVLRVEAGVPRWGFELTEETIPVEAGLEKTAVDYEKGCYIGQEVISRLRSIGHVNKELRGFVGEHDARLASGMRLHDPTASDKECGWLTSAVFSRGLDRHAALGYLKRGVTARRLDARDAGSGKHICAVQVRELPLIPCT